MWPWLARAAYDASESGTPSLRARNAATSAVLGVARVTSRQRERMVGSTSSTVGAQSIQTVRSVGSSMALSSALQAWSVSRSASSTISTCQRRPTGIIAARRTSSRTSSTPIESFWVRTIVTSACEPVSAVWHSWQLPQPASGPGPELALERRRERDRRVGAPRPGRAGEQPRVVHPVPVRRGAQRLDHAVLADQVVPDRHSSTSTRARISAARSSTGRLASSTR